jgi:hypothetical protein
MTVMECREDVMCQMYARGGDRKAHKRMRVRGRAGLEEGRKGKESET